MKLETLQKHLNSLHELSFVLPNGELVAPHFHLTEVGLITRKYIDCGGTLREDLVVNFQLWHANDFDHRLSPKKMNNIISMAIEQLNLSGESEIEVEYQGQTIEKYGLSFESNNFLLTAKETTCLAPDACQVPQEKPRVRLTADGPKCVPGSGCC